MKLLFFLIVMLPGQALATPLSYKNDIQGVFQQKCSVCHNANNMPDKNWMNYKIAYAKRSKIKERLSNETMPPGNATLLSKDERKLIIKWVDEGAKP